MAIWQFWLLPSALATCLLRRCAAVNTHTHIDTDTDRHRQDALLAPKQTRRESFFPKLSCCRICCPRKISANYAQLMRNVNSMSLYPLPPLPCSPSSCLCCSCSTLDSDKFLVQIEQQKATTTFIAFFGRNLPLKYVPSYVLPPPLSLLHPLPYTFSVTLPLNSLYSSLFHSPISPWLWLIICIAIFLGKSQS